MNLIAARKLLDLSKPLLPPEKERTIFGIGGRGYYENATSDLLAFYLNPTEEHGLGSLFLEALDDAIGNPLAHERDKSVVSVLREQRTAAESRIDIEILGPAWCLLIENKIRHLQNNPFESYERHAASLREPDHCYYVVLSPKGESSRPDRWRGLSYRALCQNLNVRLNRLRSAFGDPKWLLFAREFVLHLETELYTQMLNQEQIAFVEENLDPITDLSRLRDEYYSSLFQQVGEHLAPLVSDLKVSRESWRGYHLAIRCKTTAWGGADFVLAKKQGPGSAYSVHLFLPSASDSRIEKLKTLLAGTNYGLEGGFPCWAEEHQGGAAAAVGLRKLAERAQTAL